VAATHNRRIGAAALLGLATGLRTFSAALIGAVTGNRARGAVAGPLAAVVEDGLAIGLASIGARRSGE
jgi:hypothetical protein